MNYAHNNKGNIMGNTHKKAIDKKIKVKSKISCNYHCKECGEIPLLYFSKCDFDMICSKHKIINITYNKFNDYITFQSQCSTCKKISDQDNYYYCDDCKKTYCDICINKHMKDKKQIHFMINIDQKNTICKLHHKIYNKFCFKCKLNLCEFCEGHNNHYIEFFKDIYPLKEDIKGFNDDFSKILNNINNQKDINYTQKNQFKEYINIKKLLVNSFSSNIYNYNYIINLNNIITTTSSNDYKKNFITNDNLQYIPINPNNEDKSNINNKILIKSFSYDKLKELNYNKNIWCMKKLNTININPQKSLELIAIGGDNSSKILILDIVSFRVYQKLNHHENTVYSLDQFKDTPNFLFSSSEDKTVNIYNLNSQYKYELIQIIKKTEDKDGGEINKVIALSNKLLVTSDHRSITIWKSNIIKNNKINYEELYEIIINKDTCHLLEVNPSIFVATQYHNFQVYKNDDKSFPLLGELNIESHGDSSNGLCKINDKIVCCAGEDCFHIINVEPLQVIQKIYNQETEFLYINCTKEDYLYYKGRKYIYQHKIIKDEDNNFVELDKCNKYLIEESFLSYERAMLPFDDGRIFFVEKIKGKKFYQLYA